jgi:hypothetical protein
MSSNEPKLKESPSFTALSSLKPLSPPSFPNFPKFPTLKDCARLAGEEEQQRLERKPDGIYENILGNPALLYNDLLKNPDRYEDGVQELLSRLIMGAGTSELEEEERALLSRATLQYVSTDPPKPPRPEGKSTASKKPPRAKASEPSPRKKRPRPGKDVPVTEMRPFWWLDR